LDIKCFIIFEPLRVNIRRRWSEKEIKSHEISPVGPEGLREQIFAKLGITFL